MEERRIPEELSEGRRPIGRYFDSEHWRRVYCDLRGHRNGVRHAHLRILVLQVPKESEDHRRCRCAHEARSLRRRQSVRRGFGRWWWLAVQAEGGQAFKGIVLQDEHFAIAPTATDEHSAQISNLIFFSHFLGSPKKCIYDDHMRYLTKTDESKLLTNPLTTT